MQRSAVSDVIALCPDKCHSLNDKSSGESMERRANLDAGLSIGFGAAAVVALGVGTYLLLTKPAKSPVSAWVAPWIAPSARGTPAGVSLRAQF
jgi:hypothetical protein